MHSPEQARRPQQKKQRPELNLNTAAATLPNQRLQKQPVLSKSNRGPPLTNFKVPLSGGSTANSKRSSEDSFLENDFPDDIQNPNGHRHQRPPRDSHDLSLPNQDFTRDSLLGNMLNSLDQFSLSNINTPTAHTFNDDGDPYGVPRHDSFSPSMTNTSRPPANLYSTAHPHPHAHGYSYSSDFEGFDDAASKISSQFSRGRRSNSSSNFQAGGLPRINSMREPSLPKRPLHSRGGKTSKSSSTTSFDGAYAQTQNAQRRAQADRARSSSLDYGESGAWKTENDSTFLVDDYDAAPNPTVPGGPRRPPLPAMPPPPPSAVPSEHDTKSSDRQKGARSRSGTNKTTQSKYAPSRDVAPPVPSFGGDSAPAPHVGYEKSKVTQQPAEPAATPPVKEKQGFFSRLFGGSRSNTPPAVPAVTAEPPTSAPAAPTPVVPHPSGTNKTQHIASQMKSQSAPPTRDSDPLPAQPPHIIQKKSSFFRRRKKSVAEPPVPPLPLPHHLDLSKISEPSIPKAEQSPVSSLRQVMSPYLKGGQPATPQEAWSPHRDSNARLFESEMRAESNRRTRGFSPEYEPSPNATIRTVKSTSALKNQESKSGPRWGGHVDSPKRPPPGVPPKPKAANDPDSTTFFNDSSDEEKGTTPRQKPRGRPQTSKANSSPAFTLPKKNLEPLPRIQDGAKQDIAQAQRSPSLLLQKNTTDGDQTPVSLEVPSAEPRPALSRSASSVPSVTVDSSQASPQIPNGPLDEPEVSIGEPTEDDRQKAQGIFDGDEDFIQKQKAAAWMGEEGPVRQRTLRAYMDLYDFKNQSVITALRQVCTRLVFRAETQQVDRILVAFSTRWCTCNPNHGFKATDVIHTMCYSIMLLNTDLHLADIDQKMTRSQFVKNTMTTIQSALADSVPEAFNRSSILPSKGSLLNPIESDTSTPVDGESEKPSWRASFKPPPRSESSLGFHSDTPVDTCGPLVKAPFDGTIKAWEGQVEVVLKDVYTSIRDEKLPLFGADPNFQQPQPQTGLSVIGMLKRTPSVLSKAPSESQISLRGRINESARSQTAGRWSSKSRSRPRFGGNGFSSSRTSFEDGNSIWSPTGSSATWSRYSLGRTQTSPSMDSFASGYPYGEYQQSIGFANALGQAIGRDDSSIANSAQSIMSDEFPNNQLLEDESLELLGPPWVKEGLVIHKHHLDGVDKKAKDRNWNEVFAVVQKGTMSLFSFSTKSMRQKARNGRKHAAGAVVGGGNWQENATNMGSFSLRQTLASALPPPGYSRTRPHVWALSLPSGAVHLFQVGTPEISKEFVLTVNYWSARLSTHPLMGGVSNIEYGWSDSVINTALVGTVDEPPTMPKRPDSAAAGRTSMHSRQGSLQNSIRSSFDVGGNNRTKLPGDRIYIAEWTPPSQSLRPSQCSEAEQLETLLAYVKSVEDELQQHNQLRSPMLLAFTPRGNNAGKAMANWERKSSYLLREIVKFRTYADCLQHAGERRGQITAERENARKAARGEEISDEDGDEEGDMTLKVA